MAGAYILRVAGKCGPCIYTGILTFVLKHVELVDGLCILRPSSCLKWVLRNGFWWGFWEELGEQLGSILRSVATSMIPNCYSLTCLTGGMRHGDGEAWNTFPAQSAHNRIHCNDSAVSLHSLTVTCQSWNAPDVKSNIFYSFWHDLLAMT